jgi:cysteine-rich repeat protein
VNGGGVKNSSHLLTCYAIKAAKGQPKHVPVTGIHANNEFGAETLDTIKEQELCIPSFVNPVCGDGEVNQPGEECDDGNLVSGDCCSDTCQLENCAFTFSGVMTNLPIASLAGWTQCYADSYGNFGTSLSSILGACTEANLLLACRTTGSPMLLVAANAPRADVIFDTGTSSTPHDANGVGWYYNGSYSWGFAPQGDPINRNACATVASPTYPGGPDPDKRLCWHTSSGTISSGWRCGNDDFLGNGFDRLVFQRP